MANAISDHISRTLLRKDYSGLEPAAQDLINRIVELAPQPAPDTGKATFLDALAASPWPSAPGGSSAGSSCSWRAGSW